MNCVVSECVHILSVKPEIIELHFLIHVNEKIDGWRYGLNICYRLPRAWLVHGMLLAYQNLI